MILIGITFLGFQNHSFQALSCSFPELSLRQCCQWAVGTGPSNYSFKEIDTYAGMQVHCFLWEGGKVENQGFDAN